MLLFSHASGSCSPSPLRGGAGWGSMVLFTIDGPPPPTPPLKGEGSRLPEPSALAIPMTELVFFINQVVIAGAVLGCTYALGAVGIALLQRFQLRKFL